MKKWLDPIAELTPAHAAAYAAAHATTLKQCADIVRKHYPTISLRRRAEKCNVSQ